MREHFLTNNHRLQRTKMDLIDWNLLVLQDPLDPTRPPRSPYAANKYVVLSLFSNDPLHSVMYV